MKTGCGVNHTGSHHVWIEARGTEEIGRWVADTLRQEGHCVELLPLKKAALAAESDAVIVGEALYGSRWHRESLRFVTRHATFGGRLLPTARGFPADAMARTVLGHAPRSRNAQQIEATRSPSTGVRASRNCSL
jgi:flavodoxin-like protein